MPSGENHSLETQDVRLEADAALFELFVEAPHAPSQRRAIQAQPQVAEPHVEQPLVVVAGPDLALAAHEPPVPRRGEQGPNSTAVGRLRAAARRPAVDAGVAGAVANHDLAALVARRRVGLGHEDGALTLVIELLAALGIFRL